ncbi:Ubiquitin-like_domain superfamily [Hexamita inflata]|uniref:Ubiquitin-like domain superfamily n=1 Tax=Hexamita inflata TaxID=28002 RepID=A0AA86NPZ7_9EUKA|nr:Ubiquitin-like domain superfamily [Hexamita inflata]
MKQVKEQQKQYDPTFSGNSIKITINSIDMISQDGWTAYELRQVIVFTFSLMCGPNSFDIYFQDELLSDILLTLADYGIQDGSNLTLIHKQKVSNKCKKIFKK